MGLIELRVSAFVIYGKYSKIFSQSGACGSRRDGWRTSTRFHSLDVKKEKRYVN